MAKLIIKQKKSVIGSKPSHRSTIRRLGLKRINDTVVQEDSPAIRGMISLVKHLIEVKEND
ncbi:MAG: 50S ribosomal protein L30 [Chloroflexi bacterium]|jgi:large subunit ribosomal protein L30|nr:50S ribosomal protein L30 [Chloroflexota bacterium]|tara:strand:- start:351 stop:533 length:183 start_codon:yes stop_codon:yes gene_type:complete